MTHEPTLPRQTQNRPCMCRACHELARLDLANHFARCRETRANWPRPQHLERNIGGDGEVQSTQLALSSRLQRPDPA